MRVVLLLTAVFTLALAGLALAYPLAVVVQRSLSGTGDSIGFDTFAKVLSSPYYMRALRETLAFCAVTSALSLIWAVPLAWRMGRNLRGAAALRSLCQVNFAFAGILYGMLIIALMGNAGALVLLEQAIFGTQATRGLAFTTLGLAITYLSFQIPRSALILGEAVERLDPNLVPAARTLGARASDAAFLVVLPLLRPALIEAASFSFILGMGSFGPALLIAKTVTIFPAVAYREFSGFLNFDTAAVMGVILAAVVLVVDIAVRSLVTRERIRQ